jgi:2-iminobutanoate/2-iminopropanoate deaminase
MSANTAIWVPDAFRTPAPLSPGIRRGPFLWISGQVPVDIATFESAGDGIEEQTRITLDNLLAVAEAGGARKEDIVKTTVFLTDISNSAGMNKVYGEFFAEPRPSRSTVQIGPLARPEFLIEIEALAYLGD